MSYQITDTIEKIPLRDIRKDCVVTDTHLVGIIEVSGISLFEKPEAEARSYFAGFANCLNQLPYPVQLVVHSRPQRISEHVEKIKQDLKENDYEIRMEKNPEWFNMYYEEEIRDKTMTMEELRRKYNEAPEEIRRSMVNSYAERMESIIRRYGVREKRYFVVISTLESPTRSISEADQQKYIYKDYDIPSLFEQDRRILEDRLEDTIKHLRAHVGLNTVRYNDFELKNLFFDVLNYPASYTHTIDEDVTEYGNVPPILANGRTREAGSSKPTSVLFTEKFLGGVGAFVRSAFGGAGTDNSEQIRSNQMLQTIKPFSIDDSDSCYCRINDRHLFTLHLVDIRGEVLRDMILWPLLTLGYDYDLSVHLIPLNREASIKELERRKIGAVSSVEARTENKKASDIQREKRAATIEYQEYDEMSRILQDNDTNIWSVSVDITFRSESYEEMLTMKADIERTLTSSQLIMGEVQGNHYDGFVSCTPLLINRVAGSRRPYRRIIKFTEELQHFFPFCPEAYTSGDGVYFGLSRQGQGGREVWAVEKYDIFGRKDKENSVICVIGKQGSGKTVHEHGFLRMQHLLGYKTFIVDLLGNYWRWAKDTPDLYNVIRIDPTSPDAINPCDITVPSRKVARRVYENDQVTDELIRKNCVASKVGEMMQYYNLFLKQEMNSGFRGILDEITTAMYSERIEEVPIHEEESTTIDDIMLQDIVIRLSRGIKDDPDKSRKAKDLSDIISPYATGSYSGMFNRKTSVRMDHRNTVFLLKHNTGDYLTMAIILAFMFFQKVAYSSRGNLLVIDELARIIDKKEGAMAFISDSIDQFFKTQIAVIRNLEGGVIGMTQQLGQIKDRPAGKEFFNAADTKIYLCSGTSSTEDINTLIEWDETLRNSESSKQYLKERGPGHAIVRVRNRIMQCYFPLHPDFSLLNRYKPEAFEKI